MGHVVAFPKDCYEANTVASRETVEIFCFVFFACLNIAGISDLHFVAVSWL